MNKSFVLRIVQPFLAGFMDGSVSTLAPVFTVAMLTHTPFIAFITGIACATGSGISMAFSEALSDDGKLTDRGNPIKRGAITGIATFLGGIGHTLPFLIPDLHLALDVAYLVILIELGIISYIRHKFLNMPLIWSFLQVMGGGVLVLVTSFLFGSA